MFYFWEIEMKLYQVVAYTLMITFAMQSSFAATDIQMDFVKKLYQTGKQLQKGTEIVEMYADDSLKLAFNLAARDGEVCGFGADPMWQSQDPEYQKKLTFTKVGENKIKVNMAKKNYDHASWVTYKLNCKGRVCKISDVIDNTGSLMKNTYEECRDPYQ